MDVKYFNGIKIVSNFKIVLFRVFYNTLMVTFQEKQEGRHAILNGIIPVN